LTKEVESKPLHAKKVFFRTGAHPAYEWLRGQSKHLVSFDKLYDTRWTNPGDIYEFTVAALFKEPALRGEAVYGSPQRAGGYDKPDSRARSKRGSRGESAARRKFLGSGACRNQLRLFPGLQVVLPLTHLKHGLFNERLALMVCQIEARSNPLDKPRVDLTMKFLLKAYPPEHVVTLLWTEGLPEYKTQARRMALEDLTREYGETKFFASLYAPPLA
jgi:uncharacterized protein YabN with tetrapyrrole methylase and pyrophosphatase domain